MSEVTTGLTVPAGGMETTATVHVPTDHMGPTPGLPFEIVKWIHIVGMAHLIISSIISTSVVTYMLVKHGSIFKRPIGERLVFYLAIGDLCYSIVHCADHAYMYSVINNPPDVVCKILGVFQTSYFNSPCIVVLVTAINAFRMVVQQKKLDLGKYDWRLLTAAFVCPQLVMIALAFADIVGPNGVWCGFSTETQGGLIMAQLNAILTIVIFVVNLLCYLFIWFKIKNIGKNLQTDKTGKAAESAAKYARSARVMMIFVVSFVVQYWAITVYYIWGFISSPHVVSIFLAVSFTNEGGLFNFFAYTYVRKKYQSTGSESSTVGGATTVSVVGGGQSVAPKADE